MPTPVAHLLTGYTLHRMSHRHGSSETRLTNRLSLGWVLLCASAPDLDHLVSWALTGNRFEMHRHSSHGLIAVLLAGLSGALILGRLWSPWKAGFISAAALGSHIALDLVTGARLGLHPAYGAALLSPLIRAKQRLPFSLIPGLEGTLSWHNVGVVLLEVAVFGLLALVVTRSIPTGGGTER